MKGLEVNTSFLFSDKTAEDKKKQKKKADGQRSPVSSSPRQATPLPAQYSGL